MIKLFRIHPKILLLLFKLPQISIFRHPLCFEILQESTIKSLIQDIWHIQRTCVLLFVAKGCPRIGLLHPCNNLYYTCKWWSHNFIWLAYDSQRHAYNCNDLKKVPWTTCDNCMCSDWILMLFPMLSMWMFIARNYRLVLLLQRDTTQHTS